MQFGAFLPTMRQMYHTSTVHTAIEETARAAEALGFAAVWANDVVIAPPELPELAGVIEPLVTLASLIHLVPRLHLGIGVLVLPQRNAIIVAKQAATLDLLSQGRLMLGVGVGWREAELKYLGADFAHRGAVTDESITLMRTLWREPQVSFQGSTYSLTDAIFEPKPLRRDLPIWVGGNTVAAARRAGQLGDAWLPMNIGLDDFRVGVAALEASAQGRRRPMIALQCGVRVDEAGKQTPVHDPVLANYVYMSGTPDAIVEQLEPYRQAGCEYVVCIFSADSVDNMLHQMQMFAEQVMPHFADAQG